MKKIFMRAGVVPYETVTPRDCLTWNVMGGNSGNLLYQYSMVKALSVDGMEVVPNRYKVDLNDVERINEEYDAFVIPLADAFRKDFMKELRELTELAMRLTIPCIVTGVGLRAPYEPNFNVPFSFDEDVKKFMNAVLDKSSMVGLRGEITGEYLKKLGYQEEKHFTVIGCPSLYMNGGSNSIKEISLNDDSVISLNTSLYPKPELENFINRTCQNYTNHYFVGQEKMELRLLHTGCDFRASKLYPCNSVDSPDYQNDRARFFINVPSWIEFMKKVDLSVGARFHGNVAGIVAGTPSILIATDARTREFMSYHSLPGIAAHEVTEDVSLADLVGKADFKAFEAGQKKNFDHFTQFLEENGLNHIYQNKQKKDHFQEKMDSIEIHSGVKPMLHVTEEAFQDGIRVSYDWLLDTYYNFRGNYYLLLRWMEAKNKGRTLVNYFIENEYLNVAIFGVNEIAHRFCEELEDAEEVQVACVMDAKTGQVFRDKPVQGLGGSEFTDVDVVVVMNVNDYKNVKEELQNESGVAIVSLEEIINSLL